MHPAAREWVAAHASREKVVEIGGRDINGTVRDLFPGSDYTAVDLHDGPGVDVVGDFLDWKPKHKVDVVLCVEVAEHCADWPKLVGRAADVLRSGGRLIFTAAGPGRAPHSALDGAELRDGEFYKNIEPAALKRELGKHFGSVQVDVLGSDVRAVAVKK